MENTATHCNTLQDTAIFCNTLQHAATHCNTHCNKLQHTATLYTTLQHTLQHTATHRSAGQKSLDIDTVKVLLPMVRFLSQFVVVYLSGLCVSCVECVAICRSVSQWFEGLCARVETLHRLQHTATHCNTLQHTSFAWSELRVLVCRHCNTLQHTATYTCCP